MGKDLCGYYLALFQNAYIDNEMKTVAEKANHLG